MMPTAVTAGQTGTSSASHVATSTGGNADGKLFFPQTLAPEMRKFSFYTAQVIVAE